MEIEEILNQSIDENIAEREKTPQVFLPWRRYFARYFDISLYLLFWLAIVAFVLKENLLLRGNAGTIIDIIVQTIIMLFIEPIWLHFFGTTPGKAIFGMKIEKPDGTRLSYIEGLARTWMVIGSGMGYIIPFYTIYRSWVSYKLCKEKKIQPWDEDLSYTIKDEKKSRIIVYIGAMIIYIAVIVTMILAQKIPPNRGDLTIAEYAENYNYYSNYFVNDIYNYHLDKDGKWQIVPNDSMVTYGDVYEKHRPNFNFSVENENLKEVSFEIEIKNSEYFVNSYDDFMLFSSLSFAGAQDEFGIFSKTMENISRKIADNKLKDFNFTEAGITFNCELEYSGFDDIFGTQITGLIPKEGDNNNYFKLKFSAKLND